MYRIDVRNSFRRFVLRIIPIMRILLTVMLLGTIALPACARDQRAAAQQRPSYQPRWVPGACQAAYPSNIEAVCGHVIVPANRALPWTEHNTVQLAVVILRARGVRYRAAPTFLLGGGPGQDVISLFERLIGERERLVANEPPAEQYPGHAADIGEFRAAMDLLIADLAKRELVLFDQRGAGRSVPVLRCARERWAACRRRLAAEGVDVATYNSIESAADVNDIRRALGYQRINLQGGSYGTRLGLEVMRRYPRSVRAAVLDGVAPPQLNWSAEVTRVYGAALDVLFDHCDANAACARAYPDLRATFYALVQRLEAEPLELAAQGGQPFDGDDLRDVVWNGLFDLQRIRFLPMMIGRLAQGDASVLERMLASAEASGDQIAWGMHYSVECAERLAFSSPRDVVLAARELHPAIRQGVIREFTRPFEICEEWAVPRAPASVREPVTSDVPTLLLSGEFDPGTTPAFADVAAATLTHHFHFVLPYEGHTDMFFSHCHSALASAFLDDPARAPDARCIAARDVPPFVLP